VLSRDGAAPPSALPIFVGWKKASLSSEMVNPYVGFALSRGELCDPVEALSIYLRLVHGRGAIRAACARSLFFRDDFRRWLRSLSSLAGVCSLGATVPSNSAPHRSTLKHALLSASFISSARWRERYASL